MSASEFGFRYTSKNEIHKFLSVDAGAYIAPANEVTIYFMKDLISGKKLVSRIYNIKSSLKQFVKGT